MKKIIISLTIIFFIVVIVITFLLPKEKAESRLTRLKEKIEQNVSRSSDHTKYEILKKKFNSPQEVTIACMTCHTKEADEVMKSNHWRWEIPEYIKGRGIVYLGKKNAINNFCLGAEGNELASNRILTGSETREATMDPRYLFVDASHRIPLKRALSRVREVNFVRIASPSIILELNPPYESFPINKLLNQRL